MFWKITELIIRIVYFRRFRQAKRIEQAILQLADGKPEEALERLVLPKNGVHDTLRPLHMFAQGKILMALHRTEEAEAAFMGATEAAPDNPRFHLELAVLYGTTFRRDKCRQRLERAAAVADDTTRSRIEELANLLNAIETGETETDFTHRAERMAALPILDNRTLGLPPDERLLRQWFIDDPTAARAHRDDLAILLGHAEIRNGGIWNISFIMDDSHVRRPDDTIIYPFREIDRLLKTSTEN